MKRVFVPTDSAMDWQPLLAKPQLHWKKGASAMTLAACWEAAPEGIPESVLSPLRDSGVPTLSGLRLLAAFPEYTVPLPGGTTASQTDLMVVARSETGLVVLAVEGKVEESAGPTVAEKRDIKSKGVKERLAFLHKELGLTREIAGHIRYQFLHRLASAAMTARDFHAEAAVMVIHSFSESSAGYSDFEAFCRQVNVEPVANSVIRFPGIASPATYLLWADGEQEYREEDVGHGAKINLFIGTRRLTESREDHLTEFIAALLAESSRFRAAYSDLVIGSYARGRGWAAPEIEQIRTQVAFSDGRDVPDMTLHLADGHVIAVEHKIESREGNAKPAEQPSQLRRYLSIEKIDGLAYFRATREALGNDIAEHPKYIRGPKDSAHFNWRDLYPLLEKQGGWFARWLTIAFDGMGFRPAVEKLGDWSNEEHRRNFALFWTKTRHLAESRFGWQTASDSVVGLYLSGSKNSIAETIWIYPEEFSLLRVRVTPKAGNLDEVSLALERLSARRLARSERIPIGVTNLVVPRKMGRVEVVEASMSLANVLGGRLDSADHVEAKLAGAIEPILEVL